ncbi:MAG: guanylate kinase [Hydrogenothermaceae bacterium]|nr:guanylate kinase [Hydrogenothermaceae bacterium]
MRGNLYVVSSPAGAGKTTIVNLLLQELPSLRRIVTYTTRNRRKNEIDGMDYVFKTTEEFEVLIRQEAFLEYATVHGNYYGTPKREVFEYIDQGFDVVLVIDIQGMRQVKASFSQTITIFILPPSLEELIQRMRIRGENPEEIQKRLKTASLEFPAWRDYDYIVINDSLEKAKNEIKCIILSNRLRKSNFDPSQISDESLRSFLV